MWRHVTGRTDAGTGVFIYLFYYFATHNELQAK